MTRPLATEKRTRPADGGIVWHDKLNAFECFGCGEFEEIRMRRDRTPEQLAILRELLVADHTECWEFNDVRMAKLQRRFRKAAKRHKNLGLKKAQRSGRC